MHAELAWHREQESSPPDAKGRSALPTPGTSPPELTHRAVPYDQPGLGTVAQACPTWRNDENPYTCASVPLCCAGFKAKGDGPDQIHWHDCGIAVKALVAAALFVGYPEHHRTPSVAQHPLLACCPPLCGPLLRQICSRHSAPPRHPLPHTQLMIRTGIQHAAARWRHGTSWSTAWAQSNPTSVSIRSAGSLCMPRFLMHSSFLMSVLI